MYKFLVGTKIIIEVLFPGEFRIGWEYEGVKYVPGSGSYYDLDTALDQAWQAFCREFPHLTKRAPDARKSALKKVSSNKKGSAKPARG